ncbi:MAG: cydD [Glaciihabitans sp.]|nr:cydD [Glaciihabitans sp.]
MNKKAVDKAIITRRDPSIRRGWYRPTDPENVDPSVGSVASGGESTARQRSTSARAQGDVSARRGPRAGFARAGLGPGGTRTLYILGLLSGLKALALVVLADSLARGIVAVINATDAWQGAVALGLAAGILRAVAHWATQAFAAREALGVKERTRQELAVKLVGEGGGSVGSMTALATRGLDELDKYYAVVLPAMMSAAVIPAVVVVRVLFADWVSALVRVLTLPLVPVFMALIGMYTQDRVSAASAALGRLSDNLVELARGLPVLVGLGRVDEQTEALRRISDNYRLRTMETLRTAFLSSLALELISTISVAVVAVFVGVRLVTGDLPLEIGLLALILAPEAYAPFRDLGAAFHAAQDGVLSLRRARTVIDAPAPPAFLAPAAGPSAAAGPAIVASGVTVRYDGRSEAAVDNLSFSVPARSITAICGASGSGKSTVLAILAGRLRDGTGGASVSGSIIGVDTTSIAWVPQHPHTVGDTVRDELRIYATAGSDGPDDRSGEQFDDRVDARINQLLAELRLSGVADSDPAQLSPGELRRVAVARALLRVDAGAQIVLLDEPTAHVDELSSRVIENTIAGLAGRVTVVVASHEVGVTDLASHRIELDASASWATAAQDDARTDAAPLVDSAAGNVDSTSYDSTNATGPDSDTAPATSTGILGVLRLLAGIIRPARGRFVLAVFLGVLAALFAVSLNAVSGWLIVKASTQPSMMYLMVAIVGVRFFGVGRSALRYAERLVTHDGIFASVTVLRVRVWKALAHLGTASRKLLRGGTALDYLVVTADSVRDLAPRVLMPPIIGVLTGLAAVVAVFMLHPVAVPLLLVCLAVSLLVAPAAAVWGDRFASRGQMLIRSEVARRFAALLGAAEDLRTNNADASVRQQVRELDRRAGTAARRSAWALGLGGAVVVIACCSTSLLMLVVSIPAITAGTLPGEIVAVLVLLPLGLLEPLLSVVDAVQQWPSLASAVRRLEPFTSVATGDTTTSIKPGTAGKASAARNEPARNEAAAGDTLGAVTTLELRDLSARWPDSDAPVFTGLNATVSAGQWLIVAGPSGAGKSTLLSLLLGYLTPAAGEYRLNNRPSTDLDGAALRRHIAWAPQEGHLFDSTLRANLLLARPHTDAPSDTEMLEALRLVGLADFVATLPAGLDTRVGSEGDQLSGGQRQRVAVARTMLTRAEVVLLDEPTAHLDGEAANRLMEDLRVALAEKVVVLVTHHLADRRSDDTVLRIGRTSDRRPAAPNERVTVAA